MPDEKAASSTSSDGPARSARPYPDMYARRVLSERRRKDEAFRGARWSPPSSRQQSFEGLAYFQPDVSFRFTGLRLEPIHGDDDGRPFEIQTSDARPRPAYRLGRLLFVVDGRELALTAYRLGSSRPDTLFVPFRDATTGRETYGAGGYLDIRVDADGSYVLDFNFAYNPYCAYSDSYSCPLPPAENWLPVRIKAGERTQ